MRVDFESSDLSSDTGLLLSRKFAVKVGLVKLIYSLFHTDDTVAFKIYIDSENTLQVIFQTIAAYFADNCDDELTVDPVYKAVHEKETHAMKPTISPFDYHYRSHGHHILLRFNGIIDDLLKAQLRDETHYCNKDAD